MLEDDKSKSAVDDVKFLNLLNESRWLLKGRVDETAIGR
jgi:hypothetical protein